MAGVATKQNVTLALDKRLIQRARVQAARQGTSISGYLTRVLEQLAAKDAEVEPRRRLKDPAYQQARKRALKLMRDALPLGVGRPRRDDLHERHAG